MSVPENDIATPVADTAESVFPTATDVDPSGSTYPTPESGYVHVTLNDDPVIPDSTPPSQVPVVPEKFSDPVESTVALTPAPQQPADSTVKPLPTQVSDDEPIEADPELDEIARLLEEPAGPFELSTGTVVVIRQMKLREFLRLLRIVTRGASTSMGSLKLDFDNPDQFVQTFLAMILFAIPESENETIDFIQSIVDPVNLTGEPKSDADKRIALYDELDNPEPEDVINIIGKIVASEGRDLQALGKRLKAMFSVAKKMGLTGSLMK